MNDQNKETTTQNKQQFKAKEIIMNDIIKILADNNLTITDSKNILYETFKVICKQKVMSSDASIGWINANDYRNKINN